LRHDGRANSVTFGLFNNILGDISGAAIGISHNLAFDQHWDDPEAIGVSQYMLGKMYSYGVFGSACEIGSDFTYSKHLLFEDPVLGDRYTEAKMRFAMMDAKIHQRSLTINGHTQYYNKLASVSEGNNNIWYDKVGHRMFGAMLGGDLYYYGFEVWGEPYERWQTDDYQDDYWTNDEPQFPFNYNVKW
jgi:hypothetical protein